VLTWPEGNKYEGMFANDKMCGKGKMTWSNGDVYIGEWKNNKANGEGKF